MKKACLILVVNLAALLAFGARASAHIVTIDNTLNLVADRDHATGELMVPIQPMLKWSAALAGRAAADKTDDSLAYAKTQGEKILESIYLTYGEIEMKGKITGVSLRTVDLGLAEDSKPQEMAVYAMDFAPEKQLAAPPADITFGHSLLAVPEQFAEVDVTVMCMVRFRQSYEKSIKTDSVASDEHVTFKCNWPAVATQPVIASPVTAPASPLKWYLAAGVGLVAAIVIARPIMMPKKKEQA